MTLGETVIQDAAFIGGAVSAGWLATKRVKAADFGMTRVEQPGRAVALAAAGWVTFVVFTAAWASLIDTTAKQSITKELGVSSSALLWAAAALLLTVMAPIAEEFLFRGFVFPVIWRRFGLVAGALGSGILFGLLHDGSSPVELLLPLAVLGFLLSFLRALTGSLLPCFAVHSLNNSIAYGSMEGLSAAKVALLAAVGLAATLTIGTVIARRE